MSALKIHVTGAGSVTHPAERAILVLDATSQHLSTSEEASAIVTATTVLIRDAIAPYCPPEHSPDSSSPTQPKTTPISHYSMSTLDTTSHRDRKPPGSAPSTYDITYTARAQFHIKFTCFRTLSALATTFSALPNISIKKVEWHLTDATLSSLKGTARQRAARDAVQRARDYAEVFAGLRKEEVEGRVRASEVKEERYYQEHTRPQLHVGKGARGLGSREEGREEVVFVPEDVRLEVQVTGTFEVVG